MDYDYDLLTIGAGSGGVAASRRAALHGRRVAIVESGRVGGTCVIRGCVPKKLLMYAAQYRDGLRDAIAYGWAAPTGADAEPRFEMPRWAAAKARETTRLEGIYRQLLDGSGVTLLEGRARLDGPHTVVVAHANGEEQRLTARDILIATGAHPVRDSLPGIEQCATSDELLDLQQLPERAAVIGGGYIGVEFASILARLGVKVSMFYRDRLPLRHFDDDLRTRAAAALQACGIELHPGNAPRRVQRSGDRFLLVAADERVRDFPFVLNATGRRPNTAELGLERVGLTVDEFGALAVDGGLRTGAEGIYAIGDVTNRLNLTPVAIAEGRALADSLYGGRPREIDLDTVATAVFMLPPIGTVGPSEAAVAATGRRVQVYEADFRPMRVAFTGGDERIYMKLLVDAEDDRVLAAHMIGADAPEIIQSLAVAVTAGVRKADFDRTLAMHPTTAEEFVLMREPVREVPPR